MNNKDLFGFDLKRPHKQSKSDPSCTWSESKLGQKIEEDTMYGDMIRKCYYAVCSRQRLQWSEFDENAHND